MQVEATIGRDRMTRQRAPEDGARAREKRVAAIDLPYRHAVTPSSGATAERRRRRFESTNTRVFGACAATWQCRASFYARARKVALEESSMRRTSIITQRNAAIAPRERQNSARRGARGGFAR